ncbi:unnamed protein product [Boreogadus saida]
MSHSEDSASMSLMDRCEEEGGSDSEDPLHHEDDEENEDLPVRWPFNLSDLLKQYCSSRWLCSSSSLQQPRCKLKKFAVCNLGVILDRKLSIENHTKNITKVNFFILGNKIHHLFINALISSLLDNCKPSLWGNLLNPSMGCRLRNRSKPVKKKPSCSNGQGSCPGELSSSPPPKMPKSDDTLDISDLIDHPLPGPSLTKDTASMPVVDRCEEEDCSDSVLRLMKMMKSPEYEKVTPREISKWSFEVQLEGEGTYECSATGLVFEVSEQALVRYSVLSWSEFSEFLEDSWKPAGSIYDVDVEDPSVLKLIHFPHSLCLDESEHELSFRVLHVKGGHADIEPTVDYTASHVKWRVSSLSKVGPIIPRPQHVKHDGAVLLYKDQDHQEQFCLHVILALNNHSEFKAIEEQVRSSAEQSTGQKKKSRLEVMPSNIPLLPVTNRKTHSGGQDLTEMQLMTVAETLGQEWEQMAIHLGLETQDIENIKEGQTVAMRKHNMLVRWKRLNPGKATAQHLLSSLVDLQDLPSKTRPLLRDFGSKTKKQ